MTLPDCYSFFDVRQGISISLAFDQVSSPRFYNRVKRTGIAAKEERGLCMHSNLLSHSHHHRESHRASNDEHHFLAPSPRHGRLSSLQARAARRRPRGGDARCAPRRICRTSACTDDSNRRNDGLAPVGKCTSVHDGAGLGGLSLTA